MMISTSIIFSTGEKKWMPMKLLRIPPRPSRGREIGSVEVFEAKMQSGRIAASTFCDHLGLHLRILEHRLDDEVAILEVGVIARTA